ncbi:MAG: hypothetical protein EBT98_02770 [Opitutaceae bacterium]|nr:hypothetical protein [Opitutaceae bacterium]
MNWHYFTLIFCCPDFQPSRLGSLPDRAEQIFTPLISAQNSPKSLVAIGDLLKLVPASQVIRG